MVDITIDENRAERIIARILRDHMLPEKTNTVASSVRSNLLAAMATPSKPGLKGWRIINGFAPFRQDEQFLEELRSFVPDADHRLADDVWQLVYKFAVDLPSDVADPRNY